MLGSRARVRATRPAAADCGWLIFLLASLSLSLSAAIELFADVKGGFFKAPANARRPKLFSYPSELFYSRGCAGCVRNPPLNRGFCEGKFSGLCLRLGNSSEITTV